MLLAAGDLVLLGCMMMCMAAPALLAGVQRTVTVAPWWSPVMHQLQQASNTATQQPCPPPTAYSLHHPLQNLEHQPPCPLPNTPQGWYQDVGFSIMVLLMLNSVLPALFSWGMKALQRLMRCCTLRLVPTASQDRYNALWIGREFVLCQRWVCPSSSSSQGASCTVLRKCTW